ncbi:MAG: DmsE family decaheme c-type cytochrome [Elusimicrobia bacterium]|nr:DmsE family decaheme c-type cytochrome [Elusimicrobiota bacterium]
MTIHPARRLLHNLRRLTFLAVIGSAWAIVAWAQQPETASPAPAAAPAETEKVSAPAFVGAATCLSCHADRENFKENIHAKAWPKAKGIEFEKSCETCHGPGGAHAAGDVAAIFNPAKAAGAKASAACLSCHAGDKQRLFWSNSAHDRKGSDCLSCHKMHGSHDRLLKKETELETCASCHRDVNAALHKRSKHPLRDSSMPDGQGKMACSSCHNPHGSQSEKLIAGKSVNDKCFECHAEKKAPMLWEHGPVKEDCLICHTPHGSSNNKLLVTKVPRLCQQCHMQGRHQSGTLAGNSVYAVGRSCLNCHSMVHGSNHPSGAVLQR